MTTSRFLPGPLDYSPARGTLLRRAREIENQLTDPSPRDMLVKLGEQVLGWGLSDEDAGDRVRRARRRGYLAAFEAICRDRGCADLLPGA